ncbi:16S rRNA C967 or C1407 C5-methylase (RsmB/RsmF family) [Chitinophaga skermanii]|uniref:16S rRNA C967 or C1407 C5-methylase (RsmB/RsmF family) n=1 Tax=Chitinophaga skermanii TaxID=331697 RepID=A0A327Q6W3_9BACT|nr:RNA methyltransferase [Chitinophaga skermanii]RAJ00316.1 16S rRNA C967 or C1407 C5-methylase (RsmB/RsmF family) [Chitinophaga skermanii]
MADLPIALLDSLQNLPGYDATSFIAVHNSPERVTSIRLNPFKISNSSAQNRVLGQFAPIEATSIPWCPGAFYLSERPSFTFDPNFHAGAYYVQEASSMFLAHAFNHTVDTSQRLMVLDLCAAPGGKSTVLQSCINKESLLVANEVIKTRAALLADNLTKWGTANTMVTNNDPRDFAKLDGFFDVMVVDAPCSGSGLFRRDPNAIQEWSEDNVVLCSQRQQRILADALPALKENGVLIYATCSYSFAEDEAIVDWLIEEFDMESLPVPIEDAWGIVHSSTPKQGAAAYRFYPGKVKGEGLFMACLRKKSGGDYYAKNKPALTYVSKQDTARMEAWLQPGAEMSFIQHQSDVIIFPQSLTNEFAIIQKNLYLKKAGINAGQLTAKELIPSHQLALANCLANNIPSVQLSKEDALKYLRRDDLQVQSNLKGWALMQYEELNLGWAKILPNRINNYYPKELRILKENI